MTIRKEGKGFRLYSKSQPDKPLGPVRQSAAEVTSKDEKRVTFFKNLKKSSGGPGSLAAKVESSNPDLVKEVRGAPLEAAEPIKSIPSKSNLGSTRIITPESSAGTIANLPSAKAAKARRTKASSVRSGGRG